MIIKRRDFLDNIFSVEIILLPFLYQFRGIGRVLSLGELILIPVIVLLLLNRRALRYIKPEKTLMVFYVVTLITSLLCSFFGYFDFSAFATTALRMFFYAVVIYLGRTHFVFNKVSRLYCALCFVFSVYLIIQYVYHYSSGGYLPIYISYGLQFSPETRPASLYEYYKWGFRASSLFLEASYFAFYVLPSVAILLYKKNKTPFMIVELGVIIVALLFSTASSGVVGLILIFGSYIFMNTNRNDFFVRLITVLAVGGATILYLTLAENASFFLARLGSQGSLNQRIVRGILIFSDLPLVHKLLGVGLNNLEPYMITQHISTAFDEKNLNYCCTLVQTLVYSGVLGFSALVFFLLNMRKLCWQNVQDGQNDNGVIKALFILLLFMMSYESIMFSYRFCFIVLIMIGIMRVGNRVERED